MFKPGLITAAVLTMLLSACGGGESTVTGDSTGTDTGGTDTGGTDTGGTDTGGTTTNVSEGLGAGTGSEHEPGELTLSASTILTGGSVTVTVNGVDKNDNNSDLTNSSYQYTFSSVCASASPATASLSTASTFSSSGAASTVYSNSGCSGTDTITAQLFNQTDDVSVATPLATATATLQATAPQLGFGSGVDYRDGKIDGELDLVGVTETVLTANAVDPLNLNALVTSANYIVTWSSPECSSDSFSISSQSLSTPTIQTRYEAGSTNDHDSDSATDPEDCPSERKVKLILSLASDPSTALDTVEVDITVSSIPGDEVDAGVGTGTGAEFRGGVLSASASTALVGDEITISANLVDLAANNASLAESYYFVFESECFSNTKTEVDPDTGEDVKASDPLAKFTIEGTTNATGAVSSIYQVISPACGATSGEDTVTVKVYSSKNDYADDPLSSLDTASVVIQVGAPALGFGEGASFVAGYIDGITSLSGLTDDTELSTTLTAAVVNPLDSNSAYSSTDYQVVWSSDCGNEEAAEPDYSFSIERQMLSSSAFETSFSASRASCFTSEELDSFDTDPESSPDISVELDLEWISDDPAIGRVKIGKSIATLSLKRGNGNSVTEAIGYGSGADFVQGGLDTGGKYSVLVGQSITVSASAVNLSDNNVLLNDSYQFVFSSTCSKKAEAEFSVSGTFTSSGEVSTIYRNIGCEIEDEIKAELFNSDGDSLGEATVTVDTAKPLLGSGSGASFIEVSEMDAIELNGATETTISLNLVDPLNSNTVVADSNYIIQWASDYASLSDGGTPAESCETGEFSITKQDFESGTISTRYTTDLSAACTNTHTITPWLSLRGANDCTPNATTPKYSGCINVSEDLSTSKDTLSIEIALGVDPKLGRIDDGSFTQGNVYLVSDTIPGGGSTALRVDIVDGNQSDEQVTNRAYGLVATSECLEQLPSLASFTAVEKITSKGFDTFTYNAEGCEGEDEITISLYDVVDGNMDVTELLDSATVTVTVEPVELGSIAYNSATAEAISISTIGDPVLPKQTRLTFTVTDEYGEVMEDQIVVFELTNITASGSDSDLSLAQITDVTNAEGQVTAIVNAGTRHTVFAVLAKILEDGADPENYQPEEVLIQTTSQPISVTTGIPDQDSFDLSADVFNPGAYDFNGAVVNVTAHAADQYQNPVPDGTIVNFTAESGIITSYCTTSAGACSVTWTSSGTRPGRHEGALDRVNEIDPQAGLISEIPENKTVLGMTTITAYTVGEAGYTDTNGNGRFDWYELASRPSLDSNGDGFVDRDDNLDGKIDEDSNGDGYVDADLNSDDLIDEDDNNDGYIDVDQNADSEVDIDADGDGFYDLDLNSDGYADLDMNSDGFIDVDINSDSLIDVDDNQDGFIDVDNNADGYVDVDLDADGLIDLDVNSDGVIDKDINSDGFVDVDYNKDGIIDVDTNSDGFIDVDEDSDRVIDSPDEFSVYFQAAVDFAGNTSIITPVAFASPTHVVVPQAISTTSFVTSSAATEPYINFGEVVRDDDWSDAGSWNATPGTNYRDQAVEFFADFNENGSFDSAPDSGYQGVMCTTDAITSGDGHCSSLMHVRDSVRIIQSVSLSALTIRIWADTNSDGDYTESEGDNYTLGTSGSFYVLLQDANGNMPPKDSSLTASGTGFDVSGDGTVSNSLGYLYSNDASHYPALENLPSFGELFFISYTAEDEAEKIEISATTGIIETSPRVLKLPPANP